MAHNFLDRAKRLGNELGKFALNAKPAGKEQTNPDSNEKLESTVSSSLANVLLGSISMLGENYFPSELIGGCCPRVVGEEQNIIWNAAAEASDSERVHVVWQAMGDKIWYLAVRSAELASHPNTWCPFASLLPGMKDCAQLPVCYTYYSDESATMMTLTADNLLIHRGTTSVIRAKAERMSRELKNAPIIELVPDFIDKLSPAAWYSQSLFEDRARRILAAVSVLFALGISLVAILIWFLATMTLISAHANMAEIKERTNEKSIALLQNVQSLRASPLREQLAKFAEINDGLLSLNAYLQGYEIRKGKITWLAIVPANITSDRINELGAQTLDTTPQGVLIGNSRDALTMGQAK